MFKILMIRGFSTHNVTKPTELNILLGKIKGHIEEIRLGDTLAILTTTVLLMVLLSFTAKQSRQQRSV